MQHCYLFFPEKFAYVNVGKQLVGTASTMFQASAQPCMFCVTLGIVVFET
jgi:hypothetical protein